MNLKELKGLGACIDATPQKVTIQWRGHDVDVFVKRLAFGDVERLANVEQSKSAAMLAASILLGDEQEPLSVSDAERLDVSLAAKLIDAVNSVNEGEHPN